MHESTDTYQNVMPLVVKSCVLSGNAADDCIVRLHVHCNKSTACVRVVLCKIEKMNGNKKLQTKNMQSYQHADQQISHIFTLKLNIICRSTGSDVDSSTRFQFTVQSDA